MVGCPSITFSWARKEYWFTTTQERDAFVAEQEQATGKELSIEDRPVKEGETNGHAASSRLHIVELHEVRSLNKGLADLQTMGFDLQSLLSQDRTGSEDSRYTLRRGDNTIGLENLRGLLPAVRAAGEKGLAITRFKGLGEMNAEELRDTTLDPANRTLLQVKMEDASAADDLFRILMGDKVEPRREFIEKHALDVRNLDV